jgi:hypothetical protein
MTATPTAAAGLRAGLTEARGEADRALTALRVVHALLAGLPGTWEIGANDIAWLPGVLGRLEDITEHGQVDAISLAGLETCFARRYVVAFHHLNPDFGGLLWQYRSIAQQDLAAAQAREAELALGTRVAAALHAGGGEAA